MTITKEKTMKTKEKTMTTRNGTKRDKHPARAARILTTGIAVVTTLGVSSALTLASQASTNNEAVNAPVLDPSLGAGVPAAPTQAPTAPAAATPVAGNQVATNSVAPVQPVEHAAAPAAAPAPQVVEVQVPAAPQAAWVAPATSGSK